ncbi:aspartyl-tRNA(Asn)/glutamyl-tRNA(Gln) amidotransferase subunit A [Alkalispirochaeta americana]|uniref:Aspartyl-tRNA(Asn)/glutamyl-tRNA(Gln) amidotransferase subunit A n=1 Tax=Alkalispirochaeta americana TaxID=159291 RepID=A0A1N6NIM1_9SPIO|nr:amidase family protein [Alkalispirochaeta americana]SIP91955.1 aspartyl-tRNA(Asn)/glutamyl-tRNA(Gln) amidotransferase subunit A [Alkalispirochaeta americana]
MRDLYRPLDEGIVRRSLEDWKRLWHEDPSRWVKELRDRPARYDRALWRRAFRSWWNEIPREESDLPLQGVPVAVKDLFDVAGDVTGCSSRVLLEALSPGPARRDAPLVQRLREKGAFLAGRTQMNEFAYGLDGKNASQGDCPHPLDSNLIPGGSSSGSAWAVAAGIVPVALGSDTGGSIRVPAALCGLWGFRQGWKKEELQGVFPLAASFDTVGWFCAGPRDMQFLLKELLPSGDGSGKNEGPSPGAVRFFSYTPREVVLDETVRRAREDWEKNLSEGPSPVMVEALPDAWRIRLDAVMEHALDAYNVICSREAWLCHEPWLDLHRDYYDPLVWALIDRGRHWSETRVSRAREVISEVVQVVEEISAAGDGLLLPSVATPTPDGASLGQEYRETTLRLNMAGSLTGFPALAVPLHTGGIRSCGVHLLVPPGSEGVFQTVLDALAPRERRLRR